MSVLALLEAEPWTELALCSQTDPEAFFPEKGGSTRAAKAVCMSCEVREPCLQSAVDRDERFGIWGGLSERERHKLKRTPSTPTTTPSPAPQPIAQPARGEAPVMPQPEPSYVEQITALMVATEGHPDPGVRQARKAVANTLVALKKAHAAASTGQPPTVAPTAATSVPVPKTRQRRSVVNNSKRLGERVAALGVTTRDVRSWAVRHGIEDVPARGALPARLVDAYEAAHPQTAAS